MYIKWNITGLIAFLLLAAVVWIWGPGFTAWWRGVLSVILYAVVFFACFVVVRRR